MKRDRLLWAGLLIGPIVFLTSFLINFALAPWACTFRWQPWLFVVSATALSITAASGWMAWRQWGQLGRQIPDDDAGVVPRARMMAFGGVLLSALCVLVIVAQAIVESILGACE